MREYVTAEDGTVLDDGDLVLVPNRRLGARLADARRGEGLSQAVLAAATGRSISIIAAVEAGRRRATDQHLMAVSDVLGMNGHTWISTRDFLESQARHARLPGSIEGQEAAEAVGDHDLQAGDWPETLGGSRSLDATSRKRQALIAEVVRNSRQLDLRSLERLSGYIDALRQQG